MEQIYFTREEKLAIYRETEEAMKNASKDMPCVAYAIRDIRGGFYAIPHEGLAIIEVVENLENLFDIDYEEAPLVYTDRNGKFGWEQCWYEKIIVTPCT